jgi:hypothetical protein
LYDKDGGVIVFKAVELTKEEYEMYGGIKGVIPVPSELHHTQMNTHTYLAIRNN